MSIGSNLKNLRKQRNMTQRELAQRTQIAQGQLSEYENDKIDNIPIEKLGRIAAALRVSAAEIDERLLNVPGITASNVQNFVDDTVKTGNNEEFRRAVLDAIIAAEGIDSDAKIKLYQQIKEL